MRKRRQLAHRFADWVSRVMRPPSTAASGIDDVAQERLEHQERPQRRAVVARCRPGAASTRCASVRRVEPAGSGQALAEHGVAHALPQRPAEPARQRHRKAHLRPVQHLVAAGCGSIAFLSSHLPSCRANLQRRRQGREPFDQRVVHQRLTHLERVRHAGPVDLGIDVADQIGLQIEVLDSASGSSVFGTRRMPLENLDRVVAAEVRLQERAEQLPRIGSRRIDTLWK